MKYYALVNTASPRTGFISVGEMLTDEQVKALGREKVDELVRDRVLGCLMDDEEDEEAASTADDAEDEPMPEDAAEETADAAGEDELPELDCADDVVCDEAQAETKSGRRKKK